MGFVFLSGSPTLGGSWGVISGVTSSVAIVITQIGRLITPFCSYP